MSKKKIRVICTLREFLQRSYSVSPHLKQPGAGVIIVGREPFLPIEGAVRWNDRILREELF